MNDLSVQEGNKLIAEFDGWYRNLEVNKGSDINWFHKKYSTKIISSVMLPYKVSNMKYHSSWDWLMPSWVKFRNEILRNAEIWEAKSDFVQHLVLADLEHAILEGDIKTAHKLFAELIQWYNQNIKTK